MLGLTVPDKLLVAADEVIVGSFILNLPSHHPKTISASSSGRCRAAGRVAYCLGVRPWATRWRDFLTDRASVSPAIILTRYTPLDDGRPDWDTQQAPMDRIRRENYRGGKLESTTTFACRPIKPEIRDEDWKEGRKS
jgi:hypothetical protein